MLTPSMCILALALESHPDFPLILLFNRDERFDRETEPVAPHEDGCVHATDVEAGGTWMSINSHTGALAALTNVRCAGPTGRPLESRGVLVRRAVLGEAWVALHSNAYACFNMLWGTLRADGASELRLSACAPSSEGDFAVSTTELRVERGRAAVLTKTNDASGQMTGPASAAGSDAAWPKAAWLQQEVARRLEGARPKCAGRAGAEELLRLLMPAMSTSALAGAAAEAAEAARGVHSHHAAWSERRLQAAPFITPFDNHAGPEPAAEGSHAPGYAPSWYGTVSQTAWLLSKSEACVWVAYRETARPRGDMTHGAGGTEPAAVGEHGPWRWQRVPLPRT